MTAEADVVACVRQGLGAGFRRLLIGSGWTWSHPSAQRRWSPCFSTALIILVSCTFLWVVSVLRQGFTGSAGAFIPCADPMTVPFWPLQSLGVMFTHILSAAEAGVIISGVSFMSQFYWSLDLDDQKCPFDYTGVIKRAIYMDELSCTCLIFLLSNLVHVSPF